MTSALSATIRVSHHATIRFLERVIGYDTPVRDAHRVMVAMLCRALLEPRKWTLPRELWDTYCIREKADGNYSYWLLCYHHPNNNNKTYCVFITVEREGIHVVLTVRTLNEQDRIHVSPIRERRD